MKHIEHGLEKLWLFAVLIIPILIFVPRHFTYSFDDVYLFPKFVYLVCMVFPLSLFVLFKNRSIIRDYRLITYLICTHIFFLIGSDLSHMHLNNFLGADDRYDGTLTKLIYGLLLLCGIVIARKNIPYRMGFLILIIVISLSNVFQQVHLYGILADRGKDMLHVGVAATSFGGLLGNKGYLGGFLNLVLPFALFSTIAQGASKLESAIRPWAVYLGVFALLGSFNRTNWIILAIMITVALIRSHRDLVIIAAATVSFLTVTIVFDNGRSFTDNGESTLFNSSSRIALWKSAIHGIGDRPLTGFGVKAVRQAINARPPRDVVEDYLEQTHPPIVQVRKLSNPFRTDVDPLEIPGYFVKFSDGSQRTIYIAEDKVHNEYLDYAVTYGIFSLLTFLAILTVIIHRASKTNWAELMAVLAYALFLFFWPENTRFSAVAYVIMGIALASRRSNELQNPSPSLKFSSGAKFPSIDGHAP